jgi:hypothetical protein
MKSLQRSIKRGNVKIYQSTYIVNHDGTKRIVLKKKTKRGKWEIIN